MKVACPRTVLPIIAGLCPEATTHPLPDVAKKGALALRSLGEIRGMVVDNDAVVLGPGIGRHRETQELVRRFVEKLDKQVIIDADGLNSLEGHTELLKGKNIPPVLTPHPGEFKRLSGQTVPADIHGRIQMAVSFAQEYGVVLVLKGSPTVVASPDGAAFVNQTGNNGMATGGSGDVLSGMIGSLLGQGMGPIDAAVCAVYVHGLAGDLAADDLGARSVIAGDIAAYLPDAFQLVEEE